DFEGDLALPLRLDGGDVDDDAAAGVGGLANADRQVAAGHRDVLDGFTQREAVGGDEDVVAAFLVAVDGDERPLGEALGIDDFGIDVGEDLEDGADAEVVAVAADAVGDLPLALHIVFKRFDADKFTDLRIAEDTHLTPDPSLQWPGGQER